MILFSDFKSSKIWGSYSPPNVNNAHCLQTGLFREICKGYRLEILYRDRYSNDHHRKTPKLAIFFSCGVQNHPNTMGTPKCLSLCLWADFHEILDFYIFTRTNYDSVFKFPKFQNLRDFLPQMSETPIVYKQSCLERSVKGKRSNFC